MSAIKFFKVTELPAVAEPNAIYFIRTGAGFDVYVSSDGPSPIIRPLNVTNSIHFGDQPPVIPTPFWFDTEAGRLYFNYFDGDSEQWVDVHSTQRITTRNNSIGDVSGAVTLDMGYNKIEGNLVDSADIAIANIQVNFGVTCYLRNTSGSPKTLTLPPNVTPVGFAGNKIVVPNDRVAIFSLSSNDGNTVFCFINGIVYQQTSSGVVTMWNPDETNALLSLIENPRKVTDSASFGSGVAVSSKGFGGKRTGKHKLAVMCRSGITSGSDDGGLIFGRMQFGITTVTLPTTSELKDGISNYLAVAHGDMSVAARVITTLVTINGVAVTQENPSADITVFHMLVDFDNGVGWFARDGVVINTGALNGDPEAGADPSFSSIPDAVFYPAISLYRQLYSTKTANAGSWEILDEVEDPYSALWPSFQYWTSSQQE